MKKGLKITAIVVVVLIVVLLLCLTVFVDSIIKRSVETVGPKVLKVPVTIEKVSVSLFRGNVMLRGLLVGNPEGFKSDHAFRLGEFSLKMRPASVLGKKIVIDEILIDGPDIIYEMSLSGNNLGAIQKGLAGEKPTEKPASEAKAAKKEEKPTKGVEIGTLTIRNARIRVTSKLLQGHPITLPLPTITLSDIGKEKEGATIPQVVAKVMSAIVNAAGTAITSSGELLGKGFGAAAGAGKAVVGTAGDALGTAGSGAKAAGKAVGEGVGSAVKSVGSLFKKSE